MTGKKPACTIIANKKSVVKVRLSAVADINRSAAEEKAAAYGVDRVMTVDEVAASPDIELAVNLTHAFAHYSVIKKMLDGMERSASTGETAELDTRFVMKPLAPGYYSGFMGGSARADAEFSLME